jgi:hypothetical protein
MNSHPSQQTAAAALKAIAGQTKDGNSPSGQNPSFFLAKVSYEGSRGPALPHHGTRAGFSCVGQRFSHRAFAIIFSPGNIPLRASAIPMWLFRLRALSVLEMSQPSNFGNRAVVERAGVQYRSICVTVTPVTQGSQPRPGLAAGAFHCGRFWQR